MRQRESDLNLVECFTSAGNHCVLTRHCRLAGILDEALGAFMPHLDSFTLADLVTSRPGRRPRLSS